jgi:hypothetical protein
VTSHSQNATVEIALLVALVLLIAAILTSFWR